MKPFFKSLFVIMLAAAMLVSFAACNKGGEKVNPNNPTPGAPSLTPGPVKTPTPTLRPDIASIVSTTIDATAAYSSGKLSADVMANLDNNGLLMNKGKVTLPKDSKAISTFEVLKLLKVDATFVSGRDVTFQGVANGDCGANSRWVLKINGTEVDGDFDSVTLNNNDEVLWLYVVD